MLVGAWEGEARCFYISFSGYWGSAASIEILHGARKVWIKRRTRHASCRHIAEVVVVKEDAAFSEIYWELGVETRLRWKHKRKVQSTPAIAESFVTEFALLRNGYQDFHEIPYK